MYPLAVNRDASQSVTGVLPVPPAVMLPTMTTGTPTSVTLSQRCRNSARRTLETSQNNSDKGTSSQPPRPSPYQTRWIQSYSLTALVELHTVQGRVVTAGVEEFTVRAGLHDAALVEHDDAIGVLHR